MPVQVTPFKGSRLTDVAIQGEQLNQRREGLRLQDVALKQRGEFQDARLGQNQQRLDLSKAEGNQQATQFLEGKMREAGELASQAPEGQRLAVFQRQVGPLIEAAKRNGFESPELSQAFQRAEEGHFDPAFMRSKLDVREDAKLAQGQERINQGQQSVDLRRDQLAATTANNSLLNESRVRKANADATKAERSVADENKKQVEGAETQQEIAALALKLFRSDSLEDVYGSIDGLVPTIFQGSADAEADVERFASLMTLGNLDKMSGVLSDTDIKILDRSGSTVGNLKSSTRSVKAELSRIYKKVTGQDIEGAVESSRAGSGEVDRSGSVGRFQVQEVP